MQRRHQPDAAVPARPFYRPATVPTQDPIAELEPVMVNLGLKGAIIDDQIIGKLLDELEFMPFWKPAERLGAVILFHQASDTIVERCIRRYHRPNSVGNLADRALNLEEQNT